MKNKIIYKYLSAKDALKVIEHNTLKFSRPNEFNDPFDCYEELLKFKITEEFINDHLNKGILTLDEKEKKLSKTELIDHLKSTYTFQNPIVKDVFDDSKMQLWISCFSKVYNETLMWSHYADYHKGVCIGFNYIGLSKTFDFIPSKVRYKKNFEKIDYCIDPQKALEYLINIKSKKWKYEKELRLRTNKDKAPSLNEDGIISIHPDSISKIIIGCNCSVSPNTIKNKLNELNYKNIELIKMVKSSNSFELDEIKL